MATHERMPEPDGPDDERFVYVVAAAGLEAVREGAVVAPEQAADQRPTAVPSD